MFISQVSDLWKNGNISHTVYKTDGDTVLECTFCQKKKWKEGILFNGASLYLRTLLSFSFFKEFSYVKRNKHSSVFVHCVQFKKQNTKQRLYS